MPYKDLEKRRQYHKEYSKQWDAEHRSERLLIGKRYRERNKGKIKTEEQMKQTREARVRRHHRSKVWVLEQYGTKCSYCGCDKYETLCVDHIHNNGARHRETEDYKKHSRGGMYGYLHSKRLIDKTEYQILCHNCNAVKEYYDIHPGGNTYKSLSWWKEMSKLKTRGRKE